MLAAVAESSYTSKSPAQVISALSWLAVALKQRASDRKVRNPSRQTPDNRKSSLPAADIQSTGHVHMQDKSVDCADRLLPERRNVNR